MTLGVMSLLGFNLVDSVFVARLGTEPLAAQSFTFPLVFLSIGVQVGVGIAIAALISRAIGAGESHRAGRLGLLVLAGGGGLMALLLALLWLVQEPAFSLLGASESIRELIRPFWTVQVVASWLGALAYFGYSLFRAHGNTRFPGTMMVLTSLINLCLDPLLIFGIGPWPGLGLIGAAWASLLAFGCGVLVVAWALRGRGWLERVGAWREARASALPFAHIAGPAMISQLMPPLASMLATGLVARLGESAVAAWGLTSRLESFSIVLVLGMTMALPPWLGRCYGAGGAADGQRGAHGAVLAAGAGRGLRPGGTAIGVGTGGQRGSAGHPYCPDSCPAAQLWPAGGLYAGGFGQQRPGLVLAGHGDLVPAPVRLLSPPAVVGIGAGRFHWPRAGGGPGQCIGWGDGLANVPGSGGAEACRPDV